MELSDAVLGDYFAADGVISLTVGGQSCQLRESDDRSFICETGEFGGLCDFRTLPSHHLIKDGRLRCADGSPPSPPSPTPSPTPVSTTATTTATTTTTSTTTPAATTSSGSRPAPVILPPIDGGSAQWAWHVGLNCWEDHGAVNLPDANPLIGTYSVEECRQKCEMNPHCEVAVIAVHVGTPKKPCFLRTSLQISECLNYADFDVWEIRRTPSTATTTSAATTTTATTTTTSTTTPAATTSSGSRPAPVILPPIDGGSAQWAWHVGINCWEDHGAVNLPDANPLIGTYSVEECRQKCEMNPHCEVAVIAVHVGTPKKPCFLRTSLQISECLNYADFDVWEIRRTPSTATTTSAATTTTTTTTTTSTTTPAATTTMATTTTSASSTSPGVVLSVLRCI